jgi:integrase
MESLRTSRYADVFNLILQTGLRRGEVLALSWNDVNFQNSQMQVKASLSANKQRGPVKTIKSQRTLDLNSVALAILKRQKARQNLERLSLGKMYSPTGWDPVFANESGSPVCPRALLRTLQNAAIKAGLVNGNLGSIGIHTLRHFVASKLLTSGVDALVVSRILGHDSIQTTVDIYGHLEDATRKSALALPA